MSSETVHGVATQHGISVPHKYPSESLEIADILNDLSVQLYPTGRAWHRPESSNWKKFHSALNVSFARILESSKLLIDQNFPDNDNFSEEDAELWEYRLGLLTGSSTDLEARKKAIRRKIGHPNNIKARQHPAFIENQLQTAGFEVYIHENTLPYRTPEDVLSTSLGELQHGDQVLHGNNTQHGGEGFEVIANSLEQIESYAVGGEDRLWATFFIGGANLGETANVPLSRLQEFKELVIKLKPAHTAAFTFINYT